MVELNFRAPLFRAVLRNFLANVARLFAAIRNFRRRMKRRQSLERTLVLRGQDATLVQNLSVMYFYSILVTAADEVLSNLFNYL